MRISKGAFDVNCSTTRDPTFVMSEIYRALESNSISYKQVRINIAFINNFLKIN